MREQIALALDNLETGLRTAGKALANFPRLAIPGLVFEIEASAVDKTKCPARGTAGHL